MENTYLVQRLHFEKVNIRKWFPKEPLSLRRKMDPAVSRIQIRFITLLVSMARTGLSHEFSKKQDPSLQNPSVAPLCCAPSALLNPDPATLLQNYYLYNSGQVLAGLNSSVQIMITTNSHGRWEDQWNNTACLVKRLTSLQMWATIAFVDWKANTDYFQDLSWAQQGARH